MLFATLVIVGIYFFVIFVLARFIIPNYGWKKAAIPKELPSFWEEVVKELKHTSTTQEEYLKNAYKYITTHYKGGRFRTVLYIRLAFDDPFSHRSGYIQCHIQNYLLRALLVKSGWFEDKDIQVKTVFFNFFTHQYLKVRVGGKWVAVDPHESYKGIPLGQHSEWFG